MMKKLLSNCLVAVSLLASILTSAQHREREDIPCAANDYQHYRDGHTHDQKNAAFEKWIAGKVNTARQKGIEKNGLSVITLPVVIHIIHDGDNVGISENIPDERILSQIAVLNQDFGHLQGTPGYVEGNEGVDTEIQFCLAKQDPQGNPTTGIDRQNLGIASWNSMETVDTTLKGSTIWDPNRYINIWVCRFGGQLSQVAGYAYFPEASGLEGLEEGESNAAMDGIVMSFRAFGTSDIFPATTYFPDADKGRSLTHEMGHFFGLRHIWGDGSSCDATDYCDDTPPVTTVHFACSTADTCLGDGFDDMIENHMDYTPDTCKSIFTADQKARMWAVLQNAPRRIALSESNACQEPTSGLHDNTWKNSLRLYPNPATDRIGIDTGNVNLPENVRFEIYNPLGMVVISGPLSAESTIDVQGLEAGLYLFKIAAGDTTHILRFIKN